MTIIFETIGDFIYQSCVFIYFFEKEQSAVGRNLLSGKLNLDFLIAKVRKVEKCLLTRFLFFLGLVCYFYFIFIQNAGVLVNLNILNINDIQVYLTCIFFAFYE